MTWRVNTERPLRVLLAGGGTGGHVFPAIALAEQLESETPEAEVLFVGAEGGLEADLVPQAGFLLELLPVGKLRGTSLFGRLRTIAGLPPAVLQATRLLHRFDPDVVVGVGGYASGPLAAAAALFRRPLVLLEQNAIPGSTNRLLARLATRVVTSFPDTPGFPSGHTVCLGNPLRPELVAALARPRDDPPLLERPARLFVLGGSQGAQWLNQLAPPVASKLAQRLPRGIEVLHQTGASEHDAVEAAYRGYGVAAGVHAFIDDIADAYHWADLALCRAGATTLAELTVAALPALLVPYPFAANDHQAANTRELVEAGGALAVRQGELDAAQLATLLCELLGDSSRLARMARAQRACARPHAAARVVKLLRRLSG